MRIMVGRASGFSLVEVGVIILFVSLALVPVIATMGGVNDQNTTIYSSNISAVSGFKSKTLVAANSIMERALAGDTSVSFDTTTIFSQPGETVTTVRRQFYGNSSREYNQPIEYDWVVRDLSYRVNDDGDLIDWAGAGVATSDAVEVAPTGNEVVHAVLRVYENPGDPAPIMSLPTYFYRSTCSGMTCTGAGPQKTGVVIVGDISGSMASAGTTTPAVSSDGTASPNLRQRYEILGNTPSAAIKIDDPFDDTRLDLTWAFPLTPTNTEDPDTPYSDIYPIPGGPVADHPFLTFAAGCDDLTAGGNPGTIITNVNRSAVSHYTAGLPNLAPSPTANGMNNGGIRENIERLCGIGAWRSQAQFNNLMNQKMSRMEAFRNSMLSLLVSLEANQFLVQNMRMGFVTFQSVGATVTRVPLEDAANPSVSAPVPSTVTDSKFINMRLQMLTLNRGRSNAGGTAILQGGATAMAEGTRRAADILYGKAGNPDPGVEQRMIILVTDGDPNPSNQGNPLLINLSRSIGNGCFDSNIIPGSAACANPDKTTTLFAVAVIGVSPTGQTMLTNAATNTPNGQFFNAASIEDMKPIFDQITWQIQRTVLNNMVNRFHLNPIPG